MPFSTWRFYLLATWTSVVGGTSSEVSSAPQVSGTRDRSSSNYHLKRKCPGDMRRWRGGSRRLRYLSGSRDEDMGEYAQTMIRGEQSLTSEEDDSLTESLSSLSFSLYGHTVRGIADGGEYCSTLSMSTSGSASESSSQDAHRRRKFLGNVLQSISLEQEALFSNSLDDRVDFDRLEELLRDLEGKKVQNGKAHYPGSGPGGSIKTKYCAHDEEIDYGQVEDIIKNSYWSLTKYNLTIDVPESKDGTALDLSSSIEPRASKVASSQQPNVSNETAPKPKCKFQRLCTSRIRKTGTNLRSMKAKSIAKVVSKITAGALKPTLVRNVS